jgi:hypothetical protein
MFDKHKIEWTLDPIYIQAGLTYVIDYYIHAEFANIIKHARVTNRMVRDKYTFKQVILAVCDEIKKAYNDRTS